MAIEKLTGPRLYQLIFLLIVLISAFTWRTITYIDPNDIDEVTEVCDITEQACSFNIDSNQLIIDVKERPIMQNTEINLSISSLDTEWTLEAEGINMNMGKLKFLHLNADNAEEKYSVFLPKCKHNEMKWMVNISNGDERINVSFNSIK
ncbi:hypothetical protein PVK62_02420 [Aliivibrio sp. S3MY1]|uniref:hypothetical protein n=1 Tax=unclassified Aliivibrio TaxID=2645654 RepID=UPI0023798A94|nr:MULTISPECIES: hypothetical protein [unclassified Aliivibrio]MDD9194689.1 hypothetical protein [Aliivibrio sp. S3MY1]MDD9198471.1 hypothetical protein [Aliivibrio sp. S2MY1]